MRENNLARDKAEREQAAAQPSRLDRLRSAVPLVPDPDVPEYNWPAPEEIEGPFKEEDLPDTVRDS